MLNSSARDCGQILMLNDLGIIVSPISEGAIAQIVRTNDDKLSKNQDDQCSKLRYFLK